jgi:hypothetical protein
MSGDFDAVISKKQAHREAFCYVIHRTALPKTNDFEGLSRPKETCSSNPLCSSDESLRTTGPPFAIAQPWGLPVEDSAQDWRIVLRALYRLILDRTPLAFPTEKGRRTSDTDLAGVRCE